MSAAGPIPREKALATAPRLHRGPALCPGVGARPLQEPFAQQAKKGHNLVVDGAGASERSAAGAVMDHSLAFRCALVGRPSRYWAFEAWPGIIWSVTVQFDDSVITIREVSFANGEKTPAGTHGFVIEAFEVPEESSEVEIYFVRAGAIAYRVGSAVLA